MTTPTDKPKRVVVDIPHDFAEWGGPPPARLEDLSPEERARAEAEFARRRQERET